MWGWIIAIGVLTLLLVGAIALFRNGNVDGRSDRYADVNRTDPGAVAQTQRIDHNPGSGGYG